MNNLSSERHEQLRSFVQTVEKLGLWKPSDDGSIIESAILGVSIEALGQPSSTYELRARRSGDESLNVGFWLERPENSGLYVARVGFHSPEASPYYRQAMPGHSEDHLYTVLGAATLTQSKDSNLALSQGGSVNI